MQRFSIHSMGDSSNLLLNLKKVHCTLLCLHVNAVALLAYILTALCKAVSKLMQTQYILRESVFQSVLRAKQLFSVKYKFTIGHTITMNKKNIIIGQWKSEKRYIFIRLGNWFLTTSMAEFHIP